MSKTTPARDVYVILHEIVDRQIGAGTFVPGLAAQQALHAVLALDRLTERRIPHIRKLLLDALRDRAKSYMPSLNAAMSAAERDVDNGQTDFGALSMDFSRLIRTPVALDETPGTLRLTPIEMTLAQLRQHCELVRTKARQNIAKAVLYERFIVQHPEWELQPDLKLSQILNIDLRSAA